MDNAQPPSQDQPQDREAPQPSPVRPSFFRRHRWPVIIAASAILLITATLVAVHLLTPAPATTTKVANTTDLSSTAGNATQQQSTQTTGSTNTWVATIDPAAIPLGDGKVSTSPKTGYVDSCTTGFRNGIEHSGNWINTTNNTWDSRTKVAVEGSVAWPSASYSVTTSGSNRIITTNDLPKNDTTGTFPIAISDPAHQYDGNPNHIGTQSLTYTLPLNPTAASTPHCTTLGAIGVLDNGVLLYNGLDAAGRDAVAHETQDSCNGHPDGGDHYHYHDIPSCILSTATGSSTLVGYALDGYGIYVERDSQGNLPTNADLDVCHGRTSAVEWNGALTTIYHYDATLEYPYTIGCFHGTPVSNKGS